MMETDEQRMLRKEKKKKLLLIIVLVIVGIFAVLGIIALVLSGINNYFKQKSIDDLEEELRTPSYIFESPNYNENIFDDAAYMRMDRDMYYKNAEVKISVTEDNYSSQPPAVQFMYDIIQHIINGEYEEYNGIFIDEYIKNAGDDLRETFTMQKLYNIEVEVLQLWEADNVTYTDFKVGYMIKNNNGTFRNDLPDEMSRPVVYRIMTISDVSNDIYESSVYNLLLYSKYTSGLYE